LSRLRRDSCAESSRSTFGGVAVCAVFLATNGCGLVLDTHFDDLRKRPASPTVAVEAGSHSTDGSHASRHAEPPARPPTSKHPGDIELVVAGIAKNFGDLDPTSYSAIGYDLDHTCTGEGQGASCIEPAWAIDDHRDGVDGIDNALGQFSYELTLDIGKGTEFTALAVALAAKGRQVSIVRVTGYNGEPDDDHVQVEHLVGTSLMSASGDAGTPPTDGTARWRIASSSLLADGHGHYDVNRGAYVDDEAYVAGSLLVYHLPEVLLYAPNPGEPQHATNLVVTGRLARNDAGAWEVHDTITSARIPLNASFALFEGYEDPTNPGHGICMSSPLYRLLKARLCAHADISSQGDAVGRPCDALSSGTLGDAYPVLLGDVEDIPVRPRRCAPDDDPIRDTCDTLLDGDSG